MQRPVMDPTFMDESAAAAALDSPRPRRRYRLLRLAWGLVRRVLRILLSKPLAIPAPRRRGPGGPDDEATLPATPQAWAVRLAKGFAYRMVFVPILIALSAAALVYTGTHPPRPADRGMGISPSVYYDPVAFISADSVTRLQGWLVPVIDAERVLLEQDRLLRSNHPAVVLAHDFGQSQQQMLPLVEPLHRDGFVVLVIGLRGEGLPGGASGQTFGLNEALDVQAAVELLRRRPFVDPSRVAVVGIGTGANAAALAAKADPALATAVLIDPARGTGPVLARRIGPDRTGVRWLTPFCKWTFEITYAVDADDLNHIPGAYTPTAGPAGSWLVLEDQTGTFGTLQPRTVSEVREFLKVRLFPQAAPEGDSVAYGDPGVAE